jgi:hypothetical protein
VLIDQLLVDSQLAIASQLIPDEPEETGAALDDELVSADDELLSDELLLDDELLGALSYLVPTVMTLATAGVIGVRPTSFLAVCAPLTVVTW